MTYIFVEELELSVQNELLNRIPEELKEEVDVNNILDEKILMLESMELCSFEEMQSLRTKGVL